MTLPIPLLIIRNRFDLIKIKFIPFKDFLNRFNKNLIYLDTLIIKNDEKLNQIMNSNSWKITNPLRKFKAKLKNYKKRILNRGK